MTDGMRHAFTMGLKAGTCVGDGPWVQAEGQESSGGRAAGERGERGNPHDAGASRENVLF
jgi:hypothetical protein